MSLVVREVSLRIVSSSAMGSDNQRRSLAAALGSKASAWVCVQFNVSAAVLFAALGRGVRIQRLVRAIAGDAEARAWKAVFIHQVLFHSVRALTRELHVIAALPGGIGITLDIY